MSELPSGFAPVPAVNTGRRRGPMVLTFSDLSRDAVSGYLTAAAMERLGEPAIIAIGIDATGGRIAVRAAREDGPGTRRVVPKGGGSFGATSAARQLFPGGSGRRKVALSEITPGVLVGNVDEGAS